VEMRSHLRAEYRAEQKRQRPRERNALRDNAPGILRLDVADKRESRERRTVRAQAKSPERFDAFESDLVPAALCGLHFADRAGRERPRHLELLDPRVPTGPIVGIGPDAPYPFRRCGGESRSSVCPHTSGSRLRGLAASL